ncbi:hydrogenase maturation nickel metallochaperone HypA [Halodesulfovibrio sp.]|uniref:hydrogenase maturation nickel metallochaperone HypA n=1 Tax=Halodesulfovibrio sp. TaxID=1912772 RepID=UPI0025B9DE34|nr:hydrogenase maturation nickel metallochaperone HypA [Halodesulfovibrio sp.]
MHELAITQSMITIVNETVKDKDVIVREIRIEVGEHTCIEKHTLKGCFEVCTENTPLKGVNLTFIDVPASWKCKECHYTFEKRVAEECPRCSNTNLTMVTGRELHVKSLEVEPVNKDDSYGN